MQNKKNKYKSQMNNAMIYSQVPHKLNIQSSYFVCY